MSDFRYVTRDDETYGRDPRDMSVEELNRMGHIKMPMLKVIREKCTDCSGGSIGEVRKCTAFKCALWPYRTNSNPFTGKLGHAAAFATLTPPSC
jgi:hypothetical protein